MKRLFLLFFLAPWAALAANPADFQPGPIVEWKESAGGNGHFYQGVYSPTGVDWKTSNDYAIAHNGYLATLSTPAENQFVFNLIDDPKFWGTLYDSKEHNLGPWLGGQRRPGSTRPEDNWFWIHDGAPFSYANWAKLQPDSGGAGGENYLHYFSDDPNLRTPTWNDVGLEYEFRGFMVEYDVKPAGASGSGSGGMSSSLTSESAPTDPDNPPVIVRNMADVLPEDVTLPEGPTTGRVASPSHAPAPVSARPSDIAAMDPFAPTHSPTTATPPLAPPAIVPSPLTALTPDTMVEWLLSAGGNGHYYQAVSAPGGITWSAAQEFAHSRGGYLATISSKEENDFVFKLVDDAKFWKTANGYADGPWLGGVKTPGFAKYNQGWHWINDESPFTYTNWEPPNPNNSQGLEDRLAFWANRPASRQSNWNDRDGHETSQGFIIEYDAGQPPGSLKYVAFAAMGALAILVILSLGIFFFYKPHKKDPDQESG